MKRLLPVMFAALLGCVGCDQVTKQVAIRWLRDKPTTSYLADTFRLTYIENRGAFLGLGSDWPDWGRYLAFSIVSLALVVGSLVFTFNQVRALRPADALTTRSAPAWGAMLLAAGGVGNLIDRFTRDGAVVDFMNMGIGSLRTGIFNVADVQIMVGVGMIVLWHNQSPRSAAQSDSSVSTAPDGTPPADPPSPEKPPTPTEQPDEPEHR